MDCRTVESLVNAYINRTMTVDELEEFIHHVRECSSCYDELETYYTVYFAVRHLDSDKCNETMNMHKMLEEDLRNRERFVRRRRFRRYACIMGLGVLVCVAIVALSIFIL